MRIITQVIPNRSYHPTPLKGTWSTVQPQALVLLLRVGCLLMSSFPLLTLRSSLALPHPPSRTSHLMSLRLRSHGWSSASHRSLSVSSSSTSASPRLRRKKLFQNCHQSDQPLTCPVGRWRSPSSTLTTQMENSTSPNTLRNLPVDVSLLHLSHLSE